MTPRPNDAAIDLIGIEWIGAGNGARMVRSDVPLDDERERRVLVAFVEARADWDDLALLAHCIASRRSCSTDHRSVTFPSEHFGTPGSLYLADGTDDPVEVGESAALRLLARWFRVLVDGAEREGLEFTASPWWSEFVRDVSDVEQQASAS